MGLDIVELVMALEEEFEIQIPDKDAETFALVGQMSDFVLHKLQERGEAIDADQVWIRFRSVVVEQLGVRPEQVTRQAHFVYDLGCG
jgi:acyl carrier protein